MTGCLQGIVLVMGSYYELRNRKREKQDLQDRMAHADSEEPPTYSEQTPLLRSEE